MLNIFTSLVFQQQSYPMITTRKISNIVLLTADKAFAFCSGVVMSPDTISIIFPPNFGCSRTIKMLNKGRHLIDKSTHEAERCQCRLTTNMFEVAAINRAIVATTNFPASGFACKVRSHQSIL